MYKLAGKVLDWVDEKRIPLQNVAFPYGFDEYAVVIEDSDGVLGRKYPLNSKENLIMSMESFDKYASRLLPIHRRVAATYMGRECARYGIDKTEKVAMYEDSNINSRTVPYKEAQKDYSPYLMKKQASELIQAMSDSKEEAESFKVSDDFTKTAASAFIRMLSESDVIQSNYDPLVSKIKETLHEEDLSNHDIHRIADHICKISSVDINKTIFRDPGSYPKQTIKKEASLKNEIAEYITEHAEDLHGYFDQTFIRKLANNPIEVLSNSPEELVKKIFDILYE